MTAKLLRRPFTAVLLTTVVAVSVAACGSSKSSSTGKAAAGSSSGSSTSDVAAARSSSGSSASTVAAAAAAIQPYVGHPSPFPVTDKLTRVPKGAKIAYMDCGTPYCAFVYSLMQPAATAMGVTLQRISSGTSASSVRAAFSTVVTKKPDAVIVTALNIDLWSKALKQLQSASVPVVTIGVTGLAPYNVPSPQDAEALDLLIGKLLADYVVAKFSDKSNVVVYTVPELTFTAAMAKEFKSELARICPGCAVRETQVPIASIGTTAPQKIVSDLQSHPKSTVAVFPNDELEIGLPSALKSAGIKITTLGDAPTPTNLQYIKDGTETAALGADQPVVSWMLIDKVAREIAKQPQTGAEAEGLTDLQFLTKPDITFDPSKGWTGYPDFPQRYKDLWQVSTP